MAAITTKAVRTARKLERPRPLRSSSEVSQTLGLFSLKTGTADNILQDLEALHININNGNFDDSTISLLVQVCNHLKSKGQQLDTLHKEHLDRYFVSLRNASREERLDMHCRLRLLEIIELRAMNWKTNENLMNYYKQKLLEMETPGYLSMTSQSATIPYMVPSPQTPTRSASFALTQGEVLRSSGKFAKPTKIPGKNFYKDEIIIRNSDSGKVSPGARDRLVQITGPNDDSISQAKVLIDDTIRRNASPVRQEKAELGMFGMVGSESSTSLNSNVSEDSNSPQPATGTKKTLMHSYSMGDATLGEYSYSVCVGTDTIRISGFKVDLVQTAKLVLEEYFAGRAKLTEKHRPYVPSNSFETFDDAFGVANKPQYGFSRQESLKCDRNSGETVDHWLMRSNSSSASLGKKNGPLRSSSSEEETYKGEVSPTDDDKPTATKFEFRPTSLASPITSPVIKKATLFFQPNQGYGMDVGEKQSNFIRNDSLQKSSIEESVNNEQKIKYTREFLLDCALSPYSKISPMESGTFSAEAAALIKESPNVFFEPRAYKEQDQTTFERRESFRRSPPQSQEN